MNKQFKQMIEGTFAVDNLHFLSVPVSPGAGQETPQPARLSETTESDAAYFERRAGEEKASAMAAGSVVTRLLHLELADRYAGLAATIREAEGQVG